MENSPLERLFATSPEPLLVASENGVIVYANPAADLLLGEGILGKSVEEPLGSAVHALIATLPHYASTETWVRSTTIGPVHQTAVIVELSSELGEGRYLIALKSTSSESAAIMEREQWLGTVAHDLKNPLAAIFSYSDTMIETGLGDTLSTSQREIVNRIRATAARATELVRNYQHLSKLAMKAVVPSEATVDLNTLIHEVVHSTWRENPEKPKVSVTLHGAPLEVRAERLHIERIVMNLFTNALKFADPESTVTIVSTSSERGPQFSITNLGPTIGEAERSKLFKPFSRLSTAKGKPGSGLGLSIVKEILDGLGGTITVESSAANGTTFTVTFPT